MKRFSMITLTLVMVLALVLSACSPGANQNQPEDATQVPATGETQPAAADATQPAAADATQPAADATQPAADATQPAASGDGQALTVWAPAEDKCNEETENGLIACQIQEFAQQNNVDLTLQSAPIDGWTNYINAGALSNSLPDAIYMDGPTIANFAWAGYLMPLDDYITPELREDLLPSVFLQADYNGKSYCIGAFEGGFGIYGNKALLEQAGVRIPTGVDDAWTREEFEDVLAKLMEVEGVEYSMDMKMNYGQGEWFTFGFSPILQSMGGDLINRTDYQSAEGVLNGPESVEAMTMFQNWIKNGYVDASPAGDTDFDEGRAALSWVGHWMYGRYKEALGDNLIVLPMPKFGDKAATGMGSWCWGISAQAKNPDLAWQMIEHLLQPEEIVRLVSVNGAVPSRYSAIEQMDLYKEGGELRVFVDQASTIAVPRPVTPAYPAITLAFAEAVNNIAQGADVQEELDRAVEKIDQDIQDNGGYQPQQ